AERRDALSRLAGPGGEERGATVRRASYDNRIVAQAECTCRLVLDHANRLAWGQNSGQQARIQARPVHPVRPIPCDRVVTGLEGIVFIAHVEATREPAGNPVGLVDDVPDAVVPGKLQ